MHSTYLLLICVQGLTPDELQLQLQLPLTITEEHRASFRLGIRFVTISSFFIQPDEVNQRATRTQSRKTQGVGGRSSASSK